MFPWNFWALLGSAAHSGHSPFLCFPQPHTTKCRDQAISLQGYPNETSGFQDFRALGFRDFGSGSSRTRFPLQLPTPKLLTFPIPGPITQLSPTMAVVRGRSKKVHVTSDDVIGSRHLHFSFRDFGFWEFVHQHKSFFPKKVEITIYCLLDPTVKIFS